MGGGGHGPYGEPDKWGEAMVIVLGVIFILAAIAAIVGAAFISGGWRGIAVLILGVLAFVWAVAEVRARL